MEVLPSIALGLHLHAAQQSCQRHAERTRRTALRHPWRLLAALDGLVSALGRECASPSESQLGLVHHLEFAIPHKRSKPRPELRRSVNKRIRPAEHRSSYGSRRAQRLPDRTCERRVGDVQPQCAVGVREWKAGKESRIDDLQVRPHGHSAGAQPRCPSSRSPSLQTDTAPAAPRTSGWRQVPQWEARRSWNSSQCSRRLWSRTA